jgi:hypothetical protein
MANLKVVSITDHETVRERANLLNDLALIAIKIADELHDVDQRLRKLRDAVALLQQEGGLPPSG